MKFLNMIRRLEAELAPIYIPGAIRYIDEKYDNAWSKTIDRFDLALSKCIETKNWELAVLEGDVYEQSIKRLISIYHTHQRKRKMDRFLAE